MPGGAASSGEVRPPDAAGLFAELLAERLDGASLPSDETLQATVDAVAGAMGTQVATLYVFDAVGDELLLAATRGLSRTAIGFVTLRLGEGISGLAALDRRAVAAGDVTADTVFKLIPGFDQSHYRSILAVPIVVGTDLIGALNVQSVAPRHYDQAAVADLTAIAAQVAPGLARAWRNGDLALRLRGPQLLSSVSGVVAASLGPAEVCEQFVAKLGLILPSVRCAVAFGASGGRLAWVGSPPSDVAQRVIEDSLGAGVAAETIDTSATILTLPLQGESHVCGGLVLGSAGTGPPAWRAPHVRRYVEALGHQLGIALERMLFARSDTADARESSSYTELLELVLADRGLDAVVEQAQRLCGISMAVVDPLGTPLAGDLPAEVTSTVMLRAGQQELGQLLLGGSPPAGFGMEAVAQVVSLELAKWKVRFEVETRLRGDVLDALLAGPPAEDDREFQARASLAGLDLRRAYTPIMLALDAPQREAMASSLAVRGLVRAVHRRYGEPPNAVVFYRPEGLLALVDTALGQSDARIRDLVRDLRGFARLDRIGVGVGSSAVRLADYAAAVRKANLSAALGLRLGVDGPVSAEHLGAYGLLVAIDDTSRLREFADEQLGALLLQDDRTGTDLVRTLEAYHASGERLRPAAEALFVHINTLKYRIARIEALTGRSLDNPTDRFNMYLALYALRLAEPTRASLLPDERQASPLSAADNGDSPSTG